MIYHRIAWDTGKNLGKAYNREMELLPNSDDFCCFIDSDAMFTTTFFGKHLEDIVAKYPDVGVFTCMTNRVGCKWQLAPSVDWDNNDMKYHRLIGEVLQDDLYYDVEDVTNKPRGEVMSGVLMMVRRDVWKRVGGFKEEKMLGIDSDFHWRCQKHKEKIYLMNGVYVYHWYRGGNRNNKTHLK